MGATEVAVIFLVVGLIASMLVFATERFPAAWLLFFLVFVVKQYKKMML